MRQTEEMTRAVTVEELTTLKKNDKTVYDALLYVCMNRGYAEISRFSARMRKTSDSRQVILVPALSDADNTKVARLAVRVGAFTNSAVDMYKMFYMCDTVSDFDDR